MAELIVEKTFTLKLSKFEFDRLTLALDFAVEKLYEKDKFRLDLKVLQDCLKNG